MRKNILFTVLVVVIFLLLFGIWYKIRYSMDNITPYSVNLMDLETKLLIATQGSTYKNAMVDDLVYYYRDQPIYIRVTNISDLAYIDVQDWTAIAILHTWEMEKPPRVVADFVARNNPLINIVILSTSGEGSRQMENVDGITGASILLEVPTKGEIFRNRLNRILEDNYVVH